MYYYLRRFVKVCVFGALRIVRKIRIIFSKSEKNCLEAEKDEVALKKLEQYGYKCGLESVEKTMAAITGAKEDPNVELSIIVPIYNAQQYIEKLCKSLLNQKTKYAYEVIFVDDGSKDDSFKMLSDIAKNNPHMHVFTKQNGGISSARNFGIDRAVGKHLLFVDNDDYLSEDFVERTLDAAKKENADIVKTAHSEFDPNDHKRPIVSAPATVKGYMGEKLKQYNGYVWGSVYSRKMWEKFRFPMGAWYEDMITRLILFRAADGFVYIDSPMYFYYVHAANASKILWSDKSPKAFDQLFLTMWLVEYSKALGLKMDKWSYSIVLEELGVYLYSRTLKLDREMVKTAFLIACNFIAAVRPTGVELDKTDALLEKCFLTRNFKHYRAVCAYIDSKRRLK
ncbi:MAG: glycosyltransferase [Clostridia bacterium]|nr:glycosyltransferase [Clostridia bacterium]